MPLPTKKGRNIYGDGVIGTGVVWEHPVEPGRPGAYYDGAPVPDTCDTVIMQELKVVGTGRTANNFLQNAINVAIASSLR